PGFSLTQTANLPKLGSGEQSGKFQIKLSRGAENRPSTLLRIPHQRVVAYAYEWRDGQQILHLQCEPHRDYGNCHRCGKCSHKEYESENRCVRDSSIADAVVFVHFRRRRFNCPDCEKLFGEPLTWIKKGKRQTKRFAQEVYWRCHHTPHTQVAAQMWLDESAVRTIFCSLVSFVTRLLARAGCFS
ncbi:MAG: hypothetical protein B6I35_02325, partial [Anaerolineaceae bacterium 4572_32.2]